MFFCLYNILVNICGVRIGGALCLSICYKTDRWVPGKE